MTLPFLYFESSASLNETMINMPDMKLPTHLFWCIRIHFLKRHLFLVNNCPFKIPARFKYGIFWSEGKNSFQGPAGGVHKLC